jgi:hypothetical protein
MKRIFILLVVALFLVGSSFAEEATLIDFTKLVADTYVAVGTDDQGGTPNQNERTMMDYGQVAGGSFTREQTDMMKTSLSITNWDVTFSSSSRTVANVQYTYTREAPSKQYGTVLGVRVHFPVENFYSKAFIRPPFEIPAFEPLDDGEGNGFTGESRFEDGYGVVKNVGTIKSIAVNAYGLNFPHALNVIFLDSAGNEKTVFMGYLNYDGWAQLTWNNPQYIMDVRDRELRLYPIYPTSTPFIKFAGFRIDRDADRDGGDFVAYFRDVNVVYDKAVLDTDRDIEDENLWNIIRDRETARKQWEMDRFGHNQILRYLDAQRQAPESYFSDREDPNRQN